MLSLVFSENMMIEKKSLGDNLHEFNCPNLFSGHCTVEINILLTCAVTGTVAQW